MTGFSDLGEFAAAPRVTALRLSPDGGWLALAVQAPGGTPARYLTSIWRLGTGEGAAPVRLTRSAEGEGSPEFLPDGSIAFASKRPDGTADRGTDKAAASGDAKPALWVLPAAGGEARRIAAPGGGIAGLATARQATVIACSAPVLPGTKDAEADAALRKARADAGVAAILHETGRLRHWDHDLGPEELRLLAVEVPPESGQPQDGAEALAEPRDLTPEPGRALDEMSFALTPDGSAVVTGWVIPLPAGEERSEIAVIDVGSGERRTLLAGPSVSFGDPQVSPDGELVVAVRGTHETYDEPGDATLVVVPLAGGEPRDLLPGFDRHPGGPVWAPDSRSVYFSADDHGRRPAFRVDVASGEVTRLTADHGAYEFLSPSPDGAFLYALRSAVDEAPAPVRIDLGAGPADPVRLASPGASFEVPGRLEEVRTTAADGTAIRGWLVLPAGAAADQPAPLVLWVHGGPVSSWNAWSWRWNPWLLAARGYAVLLPDPALSTGYGQQMIRRGHSEWGGAPFTDVMAITDAVVSRPDIDAARTAMMGGSYGGYMANWIAGHTDRFQAIVSHAGLWALDQMFGTTDGPAFWRRIFGDFATRPERYLAYSPHLHVDAISTPILIIHGDKDYRVPVGEALRMWWDLTSRSKPVKFLYFPDENHWILKPGDARVWYETVLAFLGEHLHGEPWQRPELLS
ncbi:MAG TPA: S9 family peptidase [Streptosporangiaceae bacterium]|nr:S9 family peptidase [Streptosporangiaceae bacterium]